MCSTISPRTPRRTTSLKTTFRFLFNDSKWRRSLDTNQFAVEVGSSRRCTRRTGRVSLYGPGGEKWISSFCATRYCATGPAVRICTTKPAVRTAGCELVLQNGNFLGVTASVSCPPATAAFRTQNGFAATTPRCFPTESTLVQERRRFVVTWEDQREHDYGWGIVGAIFE